MKYFGINLRKYTQDIYKEKLQNSDNKRYQSTK